MLGPISLEPSHIIWSVCKVCRTVELYSIFSMQAQGFGFGSWKFQRQKVVGQAVLYVLDNLIFLYFLQIWDRCNFFLCFCVWDVCIYEDSEMYTLINRDNLLKFHKSINKTFLSENRSFIDVYKLKEWVWW